MLDVKRVGELRNGCGNSDVTRDGNGSASASSRYW